VTADSTDAYTLNNSATRQFAITDSAFSPSVIAPVSQSYSGTDQWGNPAAQQISLGNLFEILTADTVTSATAYLQTGATGTQAGSSVVFTVRSPGTDGLPGDLTTVLFESDVYTITSQDIARGFIVVPFPATLFGSPQDRVVEPGDHWLVAEMFSNNGANRIRFLDDVTFTMPWFASVLYTDDWYNNGNAMRMFMNFGRASSGVSVQELAADVRLNLYPNPAQGDYAMLEIAAERPAGKVTCEISDMTGRLVVTQSSQISGMSETLPLDISALNTGLYQVRVNMLGGSRTLRLVVNR